MRRKRSSEIRNSRALYGRGIAKRRKGDGDGWGADIAAAKAISPDIADELARYINPESYQPGSLNHGWRDAITGNRHFPNYALTGHIADMAQTTRMTPKATCARRDP